MDRDEAGTDALPAGYRLIRLAAVGSTNDEARRLASEGAEDGTLVCAEVQTAGRGRRGRTWISPKGNLHLSMVLRPRVTAVVAAQLSLVTAVALGDAVSEILPSERRVRHKWPNDVLVDEAKVAGILLESAGASSGIVDWVVLGCGVNVASAPAAATYPATCLVAAGAPAATVEGTLAAFVAAFDAWRRRWQNAGAGVVRDAWLRRAHGLGGPVRVRLPDGEIEGRFAGMNPDGALVLETEEGERRAVSAGDVFF